MAKEILIHEKSIGERTFLSETKKKYIYCEKVHKIGQFEIIFLFKIFKKFLSILSLYSFSAIHCSSKKTYEYTYQKLTHVS